MSVDENDVVRQRFDRGISETIILNDDGKYGIMIGSQDGRTTSPSIVIVLKIALMRTAMVLKKFCDASEHRRKKFTGSFGKPPCFSYSYGNNPTIL
ncbi:unnamed protein product [Cylicocyclus nassatus]|uniref:Uncharacterized protein n=1 Tax=Cylicocyclus nassatus TaxID=53992 RepID=A0AA36DL66_CYLNA|nr:unnamed protein product [Cylicocyclus nassatus]